VKERAVDVAHLLRDSDPIGVGDVPEAQDEYDSYMLIRREPRHKLVEYLWLIETDYMGLFGDRQPTKATVDRLLSPRDEVERGG
jgi:hypothetical protein